MAQEFEHVSYLNLWFDVRVIPLVPQPLLLTRIPQETRRSR